MNILTLSFRPLLLELLARGDVDQFHRQINMPFRFLDAEMKYWQDFMRPEPHVALSQKGKYLPQGLGIVSHVLRTAARQSKSEVIEASAILQNTAWYENADLDRVVLYSGKALDGDYPLLAKEHASDALKNSVSHQGSHVANAIDYALRHGHAGCDRIRSACVRTILYASEHRRDLLQTNEVREFLQERLEDENAYIRNNSMRAYTYIFG